MLDSLYHMTLILLKTPFWYAKVKHLPSFTQLYKLNERHNVTLRNL